MLKELDSIKECFRQVNQKVSFFRLFNYKFGILLYLVLFLFLIIFFFIQVFIQDQKRIVILYMMIILFGVLVFIINKYLRNEIIIKNNITEKSDFFSEYQLDIKYFLLKKFLINKNKLDSEKLRDIISILKKEIEYKNISIIEKNPVFSISFAIFLAILSSGVMNNKTDYILLGYLFLLSIFGIIISYIMHDFFVFNNDKQLLFLLEILQKEKKDEK